eukprot:scaffold6389_cov75-Phaeocystis_antarctica.AAC.1
MSSNRLFHHRRRQLARIRQHDAPRATSDVAEALHDLDATNLHAHDRPQPLELLQHVLAEAPQAAHGIELRRGEAPVAACCDDQ